MITNCIVTRAVKKISFAKMYKIGELDTFTLVKKFVFLS